MKKNIIKKILSYKLTVLLLISVCLLSIFIIFNDKIKTILEKDSSGIYNIYHTIYNIKILLFLIIPYFLTLIWQTSSFFDSTKVILRYSNAKDWFKDKTITNVFLSLYYTLIINIPLFTLLIINIKNIYKVSYFSFIIALIFQFIGFNIISILYNIIELLINFKNIGFLSIMFMIIINQFRSILFKLDFNSITDYMVLLHKAKLNNYIIDFIDIFIIIIYIVIFIIIYKIGCISIEKKEIYWSE